MTTREKILAVVEALQASLRDRSVSPDVLPAVEMYSIAKGLGFDPLNFLPASDAECDVLVDKGISILLELRGDDLPPFDPTRYGEAVA